MSDYTCINCGSSNITQLNNSNLITDQPIVQELITLKEQKEDQLNSNIKHFRTPRQSSLIDKKKIGDKINDILEKIHNLIQKNKIVYYFIVFISGSIFLYLLTYVIIFFVAFLVLYLLFVIIFLNPITFFITTFIYAIPISLFEACRDIRESSKHKRDLSKINQKIERCFSLYYCSDCEFVMDLEKEKCEQSENTNRLIKQIVNI